MGIPQVRQRARGAEDRRRDHRLHADQPARVRRRTCSGKFYEQNPNFRTVSQESGRARPWQGYPGGNSVRIWRVQRDIINSVMRGQETPEAGLARIVKESNALMKA